MCATAGSRSNALTVCPPGSTTVRIVAKKARRTSASPRLTYPRHSSSRSGPDRRPNRLSCSASRSPPRSSQGALISGSTHSAPGQCRRAQDRADVASEPAAAHQDQPLAALREQPRELHGHTAAQRVAYQGRPLHPEHVEQVPQPAGVGAQRVVPARLGRVPVPEEVGSDDGEILYQQRHQLFPASPGPQDAVDEHHDRAAAGLHVVNVVSVQRHCEDGGSWSMSCPAFRGTYLSVAYATAGRHSSRRSGQRSVACLPTRNCRPHPGVAGVRERSAADR
jgi:hypothetical protein